MQDTFDLLNVHHIVPSALPRMLELRWEAGYQNVENLELLADEREQTEFQPSHDFPTSRKYVELSTKLISDDSTLPTRKKAHRSTFSSK